MGCVRSEFVDPRCPFLDSKLEAFRLVFLPVGGCPDGVPDEFRHGMAVAPVAHRDAAPIGGDDEFRCLLDGLLLEMRPRPHLQRHVPEEVLEPEVFHHVEIGDPRFPLPACVGFAPGRESQPQGEGRPIGLFAQQGFHNTFAVYHGIFMHTISSVVQTDQ